MTTALTLIATINALPGHAEAVAAGLQRLVTATCAEPGCLHTHCTATRRTRTSS